MGSEDTVSSPTFTLSQIYECRGGLEIHHFDFYRLSDPGVVASQLAESLEDERVITVVEWSDIVKDVLPMDRLSVEIRLAEANPDGRQLIFTYTDSKSETVRALETVWKQVQP